MTNEDENTNAEQTLTTIDWWLNLPHDIAMFVANTRTTERASFAICGLSLFALYAKGKWLSDTFTSYSTPVYICLITIASASFAFGLYKLLRRVIPRNLPSPRNTPSAIKGPLAFTGEDGELFRRLGREVEIATLVDWVKDDQIPMVVVTGESGVGKTSLLRAGLSNGLRKSNVAVHYWEAVPRQSADALLRSLRETWPVQSGGEMQAAEFPTTLDDLISPTKEQCPTQHVIVIDQFEQLSGRASTCPIHRLLKKVARSRPPYRITFVIAFQRSYRPEWADFMADDTNRNFCPRELPLKLFTLPQATEVIAQLIGEAGIRVEQAVINSLLEAASPKGEVSPVDIGIGLLVLAELVASHGSEHTLTLSDYRFVGGSDAILKTYLQTRIRMFSEADQSIIYQALFAMRDPVNRTQRLAAGVTSNELGRAIGADASRLERCLLRLTQKDMRLVEIVEKQGLSEYNFRLAHERLIASLSAVTEDKPSSVEYAQVTFDDAFAVWKARGKRSQYLLQSKDLQVVCDHINTLHIADDTQLKQQFLRQSRLRRLKDRAALAAAAAVICIAAGAWYWLYCGYETLNFITSVRAANAGDIKAITQRHNWGGHYLFLRGDEISAAMLREQSGDKSGTGTRNLAIALAEMRSPMLLSSQVVRKAAQTELKLQCSKGPLADLVHVVPLLEDRSDKELLQRFESPSTSQAERLKLACALLLLDASGKTLQGREDDVATTASEYVTRLPGDFDLVVGYLKPFSSAIVPVLGQIAKGNHLSEDPSVALFAGRLYVDLAEPEVALNHLAQVENASEFKYCCNRLLVLHGSNDMLEKAVAMQPKAKGELASVLVMQFLFAADPASNEHVSVCNRIANGLRRTLYQVTPGQSGLAFDEIDDGDPTLRVQLINRLGAVLSNKELWSFVRSDTRTDITASIVLALGVGREPIPDEIVSSMRAAQRETDDPELYAAVEWLMDGRRLSVEFAKVIQNEELKAVLADRLRDKGTDSLRATGDDSQGISDALSAIGKERPKLRSSQNVARKTIYAAPTGLIMMKLPSGAGINGDVVKEPHSGNKDLFVSKPIREFYLSSTEVTVHQMTEFARSSGTDYRQGKSREFDLHSACPATVVTWFQAVEFCNWLSEQEGLPESEWCYERNTDGKYAAGMKIRRPPKSGYRLPLDEEWEYACRSGSKMRWCCGDNPKSLPDYAYFFNNSLETTWPVGSKRPNAFGIFDMHGSMGEWCHFPASVMLADGGDITVENDMLFPVRGGCVWYRHGLVRSAARKDYKPTEDFATFIGFRVARSDRTADQ